MKKKIALVGGVLLFMTFLACFVIVPWVSYETFVQPTIEKQAETAEKHFDAFKKDYAAVEHLVDWNIRGHRDAGELLNKRLPWTHTKDSCRPGCDLGLAENLIESLHKDAWLGLINAPDTGLPDTSWMARLPDFDLWDLYGTQEANISQLGAIGANLPEYKHLTAWAKLRLVVGVRSEDLKSAVREVRQLARLVYSQGTLVTAMVAIAIMKLEKNLLDELTSQKNPLAGTIATFPAESLETLRHVCWTIGFLFQPTTPFRILTKVFAGDGFELCRCTGLAEGLVTATAIPPPLRGRFLPDRQDIMTQAVELHADSCRLRPIMNSSWEGMSSESAKIARIAPFLGPFWLKALAGTIHAVGAPSAFRFYEEKSK
jgi:hypothetical protein